ncbi:MAG: TIGR02444 family protein [Gammaproteobacteria bacterium]
MTAAFQDNPFWEYSLSIYGEPGVADACIFLQDKFGLDVNLLLFCVWFAASGRGPLEAADIDDCIKRTRDWRSRVVEPLRAIRRACRDEPLGVPEFLLQVFQPLMRDIELDAEHVEQLVLAEAIRNKPTERVAAEVGAHDAQQNLLAYIGSVGAIRDRQLDDCLRRILRAAFPGAGSGEFGQR